MSKVEPFPTVLIVALPLKEAKKQHMEPGKVYRVGEDLAKTLISQEKAQRATPNQKEGQIVKLKNLTD